MGTVHVAPGVMVTGVSDELIIEPITEDKLVGYDKHKQLWVKTVYEDGSGCSHHPVADVRGKTCAICLQPWTLTGPGVSDQVSWWLLDNQFVHETCQVRHYGLIERAEFYNAIVAAKVRFKGLQPIENGYWPKAYRISAKPWYRAELLDHPAAFILGARKRVDQIEVVPTNDKPLAWFRDAEKFYAGLGDTKHFREDSVLLHAYTTEKMREYIKQLSQIAGFCVKPGE